MVQRPSEPAQELRQRAEEKLRESEDTSLETQSSEAAQQLLHELRVHQVELEMQNENLRRSQHDVEVLRARYFDLYNLAPVGYLTLSEQGLIIEANLTSANLLGVARGELVKRPLSHFIFSEDQDRYYLYRKQLTETGGRTDICELRMVRTDGSLFWAYLQAISVPEIDGVSECRIVISDCTRQKLAEIEVRASKELWEKTFDAMPEIITIQDKNMCIVRANKAACQFFQVEPGELNGKYCYEVFAGTSTPCLRCPVLETLQDRTEHSAVITHENLGKIFNISSAVIPAENGNVNYVVHVVQDITEQKKIEEELAQAHKMEAMGTLAGGIAHDFNNILAAILGFSEFVKHELPEESKARQDIEQVISSSQRAAELVKQILTFSRKADQQRYPFEPHLIIKEALKMLRSILPTTIAIEEHIDPESGSILADPTSIHQIMVNLCTNASHAIENEKGTLRVSLSRKEIQKVDSVESDVAPGPFVKLSIQDTGCGMDKKTMARIFEPYFTTKETGKGSGLGLAVVHGIVKTLHGFIEVESEPGKGTTVSVYIPALDEVTAISPETELKDLPGGTERILVIDDEPILVSLNTKMLERFGYRVTATTSSREALEKIRTQGDDFDLVITDQTMPNLSGAELAREILDIRPDMPIILCSGYSSLVTEEEVLALGIKKYTMKPVNIRTLAKIVREVLDSK
ncbi:MAG: PAS domain S-box protein [Proteobacteria bacterium]|nr:PAS domain S-box protein [Pseudomonadota bacterium]